MDGIAGIAYMNPLRHTICKTYDCLKNNLIIVFCDYKIKFNLLFGTYNRYFRYLGHSSL